MSRYLLSYSLPHEVWLDRLATLNREQPDARRFFAAAMAALCESGVAAGLRWRGAGTGGQVGARGRHVERLDLPVRLATRETLVLEVASDEPIAPSRLWHMRLLAHLAAEFYGAKAREEALRAQQYLRAVHETGARVTHDVKNLLQSLKGLIGAAAILGEDRALRALVLRQLPVIEQRLSATLAKLDSPGAEAGRHVALSAWWEALVRQYAGQGVEFAAPRLDADVPVPELVFDGAADNLLQNALQKRAARPGLAISATLRADVGAVEFAVRDDGAPVEAALVATLFAAPVPSANGLGIGLYQAAQLARAAGFALRLDDNRVGSVCFSLTGNAATAAALPPA
jgi:signal transduction histidine kinase